MIEVTLDLKAIFNADIKSEKELLEEFENQFQKALINFKNGKCTICKEKISTFRDDISYMEYKNSGICQKCQDKT